METTQTTEPLVTFEQFMASMQELRKFQEETAWQMREAMQEIRAMQKETAQQMKETDKKMKETDRQMKETTQQMKETDKKMKETDRQMKETDKRISKLGSRFGEAVEYLVVPKLADKFGDLGFVFTKAYLETFIKDEKNNILAEIDITLENGDKVIIVEVKSKPSIKDIKDHVERMKKVRRHADLHDDKRKYLGAIAGMIVKENEREYALKNGFYIIEPSGETFTIVEPRGEYQPREW